MEPTSGLWQNMLEDVPPPQGVGIAEPKRLLVIGGSSSVGKTTVAHEVARLLGWRVVETDGLLGCDGMVQPAFGDSDVWERSTEELCKELIAAGEASIPYLVANARVKSRGAILEGERVHPNLARHLVDTMSAFGVFIVERDASRLHSTLLVRSQAFVNLSEAHKRKVVEMDRAYGLWLERECGALGLPCVASQPWSTLPQRLLNALPGLPEHWRSSPPHGVR